jgi:[acyl-carrier-protein] S-malonyltransferase
MGKRAFLFPGQGSQEIGMGRDLFKTDEYFRHLIDCASEYTNEDLEKLCLKGPEKRLIKSRFLQPVLCSVSLGYHRHLKENGIKADVVLGHSLGEITALAAAGVVDDKEAVIMAAKRGQLMDEAAEKCDGAMMAVLFIPIEKVEKMMDELNEPFQIALANDNAPNQVILSGNRETLMRFDKRVREKKLGRCKEIYVSGPWHSHFITSARYEFENWAETIKFKKPHTEIILNATAKTEAHPSTIKHLVTWQLTSPVYWRECMETCLNMHVDTFFEIGSGRVLSGLIRVNDFPKSTRVYKINNLRGIDTAVNDLVMST